jgi:kynureninase
MSIRTVDMAHEIIADHALLVAEAAEVLCDMACQPASRDDDLADLEAIHAEGASFPTTPGLPFVVAAMFADIVDLGRRLARQTDPLPQSMVSQCQVIQQMTRALSTALETGPDRRSILTLNRCAAALHPDGVAVGTDLPSAAGAAQEALRATVQEWAVGL